MRRGATNIAGMIAFMALLTAGCASDEMKPSSAPSMGSGSAAGTAITSSSGSPTMSSKNIDRIAHPGPPKIPSMYASRASRRMPAAGNECWPSKAADEIIPCSD